MGERTDGHGPPSTTGTYRHAASAVGGTGERAPRPAATAVAEHLAVELTPILVRYGMHAALGLLNARTRYRFTGLYRVEPPLLRNLHLFDRENPALEVCGDISLLEDTYCAFPAATGEPFATPDAPADARLVAHAARGTVISYVGVPIRGVDGRVRGTLCHFDCRPRLMPDGEAELLARVAPLLGGEWLEGRPRDAAPPT